MFNFKLKTDDLSLRAILTITVDEKSEEVPLSKVFEYIQSQQVVYGLNREAVIEMVSNADWDSKVIIAEGKKPIGGEDGSVELQFDLDSLKKPTLKEDGSIDFKELSLILNVTKGQVLAKLRPPTQGEHGIDVFGQKILPKPGKPGNLQIGKNTSYKDEEKTILQSDTDGHVQVTGKDMVYVETVFTIRGDIDYEFGNVDVNGDVKITGDVKAGFRVKATGNVFVEGVVEDAIIEAGGDVVIKSGFLGKGKGIIRAGGQVWVNFVHNQRINAKGDITINESCIQAQITTEGALKMTTGQGILVGGMVRTIKNVEVNELGNDQYMSTVLVVGEAAKHEVQIKRLKAEVENADKDFEEVKKSVAKLLEIKYKSGWSREQEEKYRELEQKLVDFPIETEEKKQKLTELEEELARIKREAYIKVVLTAYPGIKMKVAGYPRKVEDEMTNLIFRAVDNRVETFPVSG